MGMWANISCQPVLGLLGSSLDLAPSQNFWEAEVTSEEFQLHKGG